MDPIEIELNRWYKRLWETKGSRFNAAKRFERIDRLSSISLFLVSAYLLCINLLILFPDRPDLLSEVNITYFTISASIVLLVISIYIPSRNYRDIAIKFHNCARDINVVYDKICLMKCNLNSVSTADISSISNEYNSILMKYDINHDKSDYSLFRSNHPVDYNITYWYIYKPYVYVSIFSRYYFIYCLAILFPLLFFVIL